MIPLFKVHMSDGVMGPLEKVLKSGYIGQGIKVDEFENILKEYFDNDYVLTMNSATSAEHLAIHLLKKFHQTSYADGQGEYKKIWYGLGVEDEVLATSLTCTATNWPILANDLRIKWVDVDENTMNMDLDDLERKITERTKVIFIVHWGGYPIDLDRVKDIQERTLYKFGFKPAVIEDCAHAMGSTYKGKRIGNHGNICTFSLQAIKHVTAVDGGILSVPHQNLYNRAKLLRWYGIDRESNRKDFRCLHPNTLIRLSNGTTKHIRDIVKYRIKGEVDVCENGEWKKTDIIDWYTSDLGSRYYLNISTRRLKGRYSSTITNDHKIFVRDKGWTRAELIKNGEHILSSFPKANKEQLEVLIGSLLGDGHLRTKTEGKTAVFSEGHSPKQEHYLRLKANVLENLGANVSYTEPNKKQKIPYGKYQLHTKTNPYLGELREKFYKNGKKVLPRKLIEENFSDRVLAIWFMDDGTTYVNNSIEGLKYSCEIATNSFTQDDINWLCALLAKNGIYAHTTKKSNRIFLTKDSSKEMIKRIARYVPRGMRYKVGHREDIDQCDYSLWQSKPTVAYYDRAVVKKYKGSNYKTTYCIKVRSTHSNFQTSAICVHNCEANIDEWGFKFHMNDVNAVIGMENFKDVSTIVGKHQSNAEFYNKELKGVPGVTLLENKSDRQSAYWLYTMKVERRDNFMRAMKEANIMVSRVHERNDNHTCVRSFRTHLPTLEKVVKEMICIPVGWWVTEEDRNYIADTIKKGW